MPNPSQQQWARSSYVRYVLSHQAKHWSPDEICSIIKRIEDVLIQWGTAYNPAINLLRDAEDAIMQPPQKGTPDETK